MQYNRETAKELGLKYNLSYFTLNRWRKLGFIPDMYSSNQERLIQGMTIREAKNFCRLRIVDIQNLLYLESGSEKKLYDRVSISYWFSGKRKPRREWLFNILDRKITERKDFINKLNEQTGRTNTTVTD